MTGPKRNHTGREKQSQFNIDHPATVADQGLLSGLHATSGTKDGQCCLARGPPIGRLVHEYSMMIGAAWDTWDCSLPE